MSNINKYLEKILSARYGKDVRQAIHDSIKEVDAVADTAQNSATKSAESALASEVSAKASMEAAANSEALAEQYKNEAFSGTPEGYSALVEQVGLLDIATSTGNTLYNSKKGGYRLNEMVGNTEQKQLSGKNLCTLGTKEVAGWKNYVLGQPIPAGTYTVSALVTSDDTSSTKCLMTFIDINDANKHVTFTRDTRKSYKVTFANDIAKIRLCSSEGTSSSEGKNSVWKDIQIEAGETMTDFEAYCGGTPSPNPEFPQAIGNTFDIVDMIQGLRSGVTGGYDANSTTFICNKNPIPCKHKDKVVLKCDSIKTNLYIIPYNNGTLLKDSVKVLGNTDTITYDGLPSDTTHFCINVNDNNGITPETVGKITLTVNGKYVGQIVTKDDSGNEKVATFFINEPLRETDSIKRKDGVVGEAHKRTTIVFDGTEAWGRAGSDDKAYFYRKVGELGYLIGSERDKSTHFLRKFVISSTDYIGFYATNSETGNASRICVRPENVANMTIDDWKSWLAEQYVNGTPFTVEVVLTEETFTPLDTESQIAINDMVTFDGVTYVEVDSKVKPSGISGEYGTSQVSARTLKNELRNDNLEIKYNELAVALVSL